MPLGISMNKLSSDLKKEKVTERVGFEPTVELPPLRFSRPACSTAPAPLRKRKAELLFYVSESKLRIAHRFAFCYSVLEALQERESDEKRNEISGAIGGSQ